MKNDELTKEQANAVLQALDNAIAEGPWSESGFLKVIGKNLQETRDEFFSGMQSSMDAGMDAATHRANQNALRRDQKKVFVSLYSSNGKNMKSWEWIVTNLPHQMVSRPIYAEEEDVRDIIKTKEDQTNEAYAIFYIDEQNILPVDEDKISLDKLGKRRLLLKDGAISLNNMDCFVHQSGTYHYQQGRLVKDS